MKIIWKLILAISLLIMLVWLFLFALDPSVAGMLMLLWGLFVLALVFGVFTFFVGSTTPARATMSGRTTDASSEA